MLVHKHCEVLVLIMLGICRKQKNEFVSQCGSVFANVFRLGVWFVVSFEVCLVVSWVVCLGVRLGPFRGSPGRPQTPNTFPNTFPNTKKTHTWAVVKIMVPFWIPIIIRHLISRVPKKGPSS